MTPTEPANCPDVPSSVEEADAVEDLPTRISSESAPRSVSAGHSKPRRSVTWAESRSSADTAQDEHVLTTTAASHIGEVVDQTRSSRLASEVSTERSLAPIDEQPADEQPNKERPQTLSHSEDDVRRSSDAPCPLWAANKESRTSVDIVIPWRILAAESSRRGTRRSSRLTAGSEPDDREHYEVRQIAQEQSVDAQRALAQDSPRSSARASRLRNKSSVGPLSGPRASEVRFHPSVDRLPTHALPSQGRTRSTRENAPQVWDNFDPFGGSAKTFVISPETTVPPVDAEDPGIPIDQQPPLARGSAGSHVGPTDTTGRRETLAGRALAAVQSMATRASQPLRRKSLYDMYEKAKVRKIELKRSRVVQVLFQVVYFLVVVAFVYLVLVGLPLWNGAVYWLYYVVKYKYVVEGTWAITIGIAFLYAFLPLCIVFEPEPENPAQDPESGSNHTTALLIPCYKSERIVGPTIEAALKVFPASSIFVIANGNSPTPLDDTESVCESYGVNHIWSPVGSKIVAQFVGCYAAREFENVLLIDDDCSLPPNFPIVSDRLKGKVQCIGYTIKSVGPNSSCGTLCQQAQDLEYKLSGLQRAFAGMIGSATFPHGAISIWKTEFLIKTFHQHPGFSISEDWFFGHAARQLGSRITMCTSVFIETETPDAVFVSSGGSRGGFGEMTVFKQRFLRWNFFFVNGMMYNMWYIIRYWKLGWWEFGAKIFVFQEVYETLLYLLAPFVMPISFIVRPDFSGYLLAATIVMYWLNAIIFNEIHLRRKHEQVKRSTAYGYYTGYKIALLFVNIASCYWSLYKYAGYFANRHPKIIEDDKAVDVVLRLEDKVSSSPSSPDFGRGRRMTVTAVGSQFTGMAAGPGERKMTLRTLGTQLQLGGGTAPTGRRMTTAIIYPAEEPEEAPVRALRHGSALPAFQDSVQPKRVRKAQTLPDIRATGNKEKE